MYRELLLTIALLATPAAGQTPDPTKQLQIDQALQAFRANSTIWPEESFVSGNGIGVGGLTRVRASVPPGICEQDNFHIGTGPDRGPDIPRATEIQATTLYGLMAFEADTDDWPSEDEDTQDFACFRWSQEDGNAARIRARDAELVWFAGLALQALALDARTERRTDWSCVKIDKCPTREQAQAILTVANFTGVQEIWTGCPDIDEVCLLLEFRDGSDDLWFAKIQPDRRDGFRTARAVWSWQDAHLIID